MSLQLDPHDLRTAANTPDRSLIEVEQPPPSYLAYRRRQRPPLSFFTRTLLIIPAALLLILCLGIWQHKAPDGWRLSQLVGSFTGDTVTAQIVASLEAEKARTAALLEEQARMQREVIAAQAQAQEIAAAAQSQAQQEIQAMQGRVQIAAAAYQTLYERSNKLALLYAQTTQAFVAMRTEVARGNQGGSTMVANIADLFKGWAVVTQNSQLYEQAEATKRAMTESQMRDLDASIARAVPSVDAQAFVAQGLPDPAQLVASLGFQPQVVRPAPIDVGSRPQLQVSPYRSSEPGR